MQGNQWIGTQRWLVLKDRVYYQYYQGMTIIDYMHLLKNVGSKLIQCTLIGKIFNVRIPSLMRNILLIYIYWTQPPNEVNNIPRSMELMLKQWKSVEHVHFLLKYFVIMFQDIINGKINALAKIF
eukprot:Pompholyxophrys_sp_v1_NODE_131_length_1692_cov_2.154551.p2 type:complete len:125 gc:universal NODE_131_length_1692_cov_2.154551:1145-771(-)